MFFARFYSLFSFFSCFVFLFSVLSVLKIKKAPIFMSAFPIFYFFRISVGQRVAVQLARMLFAQFGQIRKDGLRVQPRINTEDPSAALLFLRHAAHGVLVGIHGSATATICLAKSEAPYIIAFSKKWQVTKLKPIGPMSSSRISGTPFRERISSPHLVALVLLGDLLRLVQRADAVDHGYRRAQFAGHLAAQNSLVQPAFQLALRAGDDDEIRAFQPP